uniref:Uncharacterized protein n=1 Tax=Cucumis melo TaxID=3656 RepID=A0A9I9DNQ7_CUCME
MNLFCWVLNCSPPPPLSSPFSSKSHGRRGPCLSSLYLDLRRQSSSIRQSRHHHLSYPSSFYLSLVQAATPRVAPVSVSHLLCVAMSESEANELCLLQPVFVYEALTAVIASPQTQPPPSRSPIRMELVAPSILLHSTLPHQGVLSSSLKKPPSSSSHVLSVGA